MSFDPLLTVLGLTALASATVPTTFTPTVTRGGVTISAAALPAAPTTGTLAIDSGDTNKLKWWDGAAWQTAGGGGGGTPAGANTQVQFNNAGAFGASANLTYNGTSLTVAGGDSYFNSVRVGRGPANNANNTVLGLGAFGANLSASKTVAVGASALAANDNGTDNTAIGYWALVANTGGNYNTAVGAEALSQAVFSDNNTAVGYQAIGGSTAGSGNVAVGYKALFFTTSVRNTAIGTEALYTSTGSSNNVAVGYRAAYSTGNTANNNVAVGYQASYFNNIGVENTAIGREALSANTNSRNTAIGYQAGNGFGNNTYCTFVGHSTDSSIDSVTNSTALGYGAIVTASNQIQLGDTAVTVISTYGGINQSGSTVTNQFAGLVITAASTTTTAGLRIPHGSAPTAPVNGDLWSTTAGFYGRVSGVTVGPFGAGGGGTPAGADTEIQYNNAGAFGASSDLTWTAAGGVLSNVTTTAAAVTQAIRATMNTTPASAGFAQYYSQYNTLNMAAGAATITGAGAVGIRNDVSATASSFAASYGNVSGIDSSVSVSGTAAGAHAVNNVSGITGAVTLVVGGSVGSFTLSDVRGGRFSVSCASSVLPTTGNMFGVQIGLGANISATNAYGIYVSSSGTGNHTNFYGLYLDNSHTATNRYGIFQVDAAATNSFAGLVLTAASTATNAGFRIQHGVAPSSPVNGDFWSVTTTGLFTRFNGVTSLVTINLGVPSGESGDRTLTNDDNSKNLICSGTRIFTVNTGLPTGFGCSFKGTVSFTGTATVTDVRTTGATNPWCALCQTGVDTYDIVGSKA